jgi:hypothetical protein
LRSAVRSDDINPTQPLCGDDVIHGARQIDVSDAVGAGNDGDHVIHSLDRFARRSAPLALGVSAKALPDLLCDLALEFLHHRIGEVAHAAMLFLRTLGHIGSP